MKIDGSGGEDVASETLTRDKQALERKRHIAVSASNGGAGAQRPRAAEHRLNNGKGRYRLADAIRLQGLPDGFLDDAPFTADGKLKAVANGVPICMGVAVARAIREALRAIREATLAFMGIVGRNDETC